MSNKTRTQLSPKQLLFLQTYIKLGNATQALIKAGYKTKNAGKYCSELLAKPYIKAELERTRKAIQQKTEVNFDWVMNRLKENALKAHNENNLDASTRALAEINKMLGNYAPEKHHNTTVNIDATLQEMKSLTEQYYNEAQFRIDKD